MISTARRSGDALPLLEEAVRIDPDFAAGRRLLSVVLSNLGQDPERQAEAVTRAYELSRELPTPCSWHSPVSASGNSTKPGARPKRR